MNKWPCFIAGTKERKGGEIGIIRTSRNWILSPHIHTYGLNQTVVKQRPKSEISEIRVKEKTVGGMTSYKTL